MNHVLFLHMMKVGLFLANIVGARWFGSGTMVKFCHHSSTQVKHNFGDDNSDVNDDHNAVLPSKHSNTGRMYLFFVLIWKMIIGVETWHLSDLWGTRLYYKVKYNIRKRWEHSKELQPRSHRFLMLYDTCNLFSQVYKHNYQPLSHHCLTTCQLYLRTIAMLWLFGVVDNVWVVPASILFFIIIQTC
jgi:hypothetical protein